MAREVCMAAFAIALTWTGFVMERWSRWGTARQVIGILLCILTWLVVLGIGFDAMSM